MKHVSWVRSLHFGWGHSSPSIPHNQFLIALHFLGDCKSVSGMFTRPNDRQLNFVSIRLDLSCEPQIPQFHKKHPPHIRPALTIYSPLLDFAPGGRGKFLCYQML